MNRSLALAACLFALPGAAFAATKTFDVSKFEAVSVSAGIVADIKIGSPQSVVAETDGSDFDDLTVFVNDRGLWIGRPQQNWFFRRHPDYQVHIVVPELHAVRASSSAKASVQGTPEGDFAADASSSGKVVLGTLKVGNLSVAASSSGDAKLQAVTGSNVSLHASSGGSISIGGSCTALSVSASSGGEVRAAVLKCENVIAHASSGGEVSAFASKSVMGHASSGGDVRIEGKPPIVQVSESSGGDVSVAR